ncbi:MAG: cupin domain-containing protein [Nostoc sp. NMS7]|uniref:cupin domain-containing protein n=1 Tax=unclassified Nostoc TaxID=2593658 RepID=UPI0025E96676|nr:cupin domain-containing protein [Nostoc sp. NMS7]MBN3948972.1 cupin domain-containing protein [Nostoc sp. NMS7]
MSILKNDAEVTVNLHELADYTKPGVTRKALVKNEQNSFSLLCLTAGTKMPEHTAPRPISVTIIAGCGVLTLEEQEITLQPGVFVYIPANTPHALHALDNLAFLHT